MSFCVYTTLLGKYELLNEQPVAKNSVIPFICLTDNPNLSSQTWQIRNISPVFAMDPVRSQRDFKIRPHFHLAEFDYSLYIDNSVLLQQPPEIIIDQFDKNLGFCLPHHSFRDSVLDEFLAVAMAGLDDQGRIFEQLNHYAISYPNILNERPLWTAILLRSHHNENVIKTLEFWYAQVLRYSRRDQLSINLSLNSTDLKPQVLQIDNHVSSFHFWPHTHQRDEEANGGHNIVFTLATPVARARKFQQENDVLRMEINALRAESSSISQQCYKINQELIRLTQQNAEIFDSKAWRLINQLRALMVKLPILSIVLGGLMKITWNILNCLPSMLRYFKNLSVKLKSE